MSIVPPGGTINEGIVVSQSAPSGGIGTSTPLNHINIGTVTPENINAGGGFVNGLLLVHQMGGDAAFGGRNSLEVVSRFNAPTNAANTNRNYVALAATMSVNAVDSGSGGAFFALNPVATVASGVTGVKEFTGGEVNYALRSGASTTYKAGWSIVALDTDAEQADTYDTALSISAEGGAVGVEFGVLFSPANGQHPFNSSSTVIGSLGSTTVAAILDFTSYLSTYSLKFHNLTVSGGTTIPTFTAIGTNFGIGLIANGSGAINLANGATSSVVIQPNSTIPLIRGSNNATALQISGSSDQSIPVVITSGCQFGSGTPLTLAPGMLGLITQTPATSAPGALGGALQLVAGTSPGTAKLIIFAGTSTTPTTIIDNIGAGVTAP